MGSELRGHKDSRKVGDRESRGQGKVGDRKVGDRLLLLEGRKVGDKKVGDRESRGGESRGQATTS